MFSAKAHYGLKAIIYLAQNTGKGPIQAKEIAVTQSVPVRYLELLLSQLKKARLINSNRGKLGGYLLARPGSAITVFDVVSSLEGRISFVSSHESSENDPVEAAVTHFWRKAEENLVAYLQKMTIEDLLQQAGNGEQMYYI
jgi:Rrf2 family cysteine metabolism transcriptional repressor